MLYRGEPFVVRWATRDGRTLVHEIWRLCEREGAIVTLDDYVCCPELQGEIATELGLPAGFQHDGYLSYLHHVSAPLRLAEKNVGQRVEG